MKTAEQYFQELAACLGGLTDAERAQKRYERRMAERQRSKKKNKKKKRR